MHVNLREMIRDILHQSTESDPGRIAELLMAKLDPSDHAEALAETIRPYVHQVVKSARYSGSAEGRPDTPPWPARRGPTHTATPTPSALPARPSSATCGLKLVASTKRRKRSDD